VRAVAGPLELLRAVAALTLEGSTRTVTGDHVRAPVPAHAGRIIRKLFGGPDGYRGPVDLRDELGATAEEATQVTQPMRLAQIGLMTVLLAPGISMMFALSGLFGTFVARDYSDAIRADQGLLAALAAPEKRHALPGDPALGPLLARPDFQEVVENQLMNDQAERSAIMAMLNTAERTLILQTEARSAARPADTLDAELISAARRAAGIRSNDRDERGGRRRVEVSALILAWPFAWALGAFVLRGGVSLMAMGIRLMRTDGRKATRLQCAIRALIIWLPIGLLLAASLAAFGAAPGGRALLWWNAAALTVSYPFLAVWFPERAPHDRWLRLQLVPR
jgi:hypothetical protein